MKNIILFGPAGAGKTTVAKMIVEQTNKHFTERHNLYTRFSLGRVIHEQCALHGEETREQMQKYGQMMRSIFGQNVWNDYLEKIFYVPAIIDDGRQLNEYDYWTAKGFVPVGIKCDLQERMSRISLREGSRVVHISEMKHDTETQAEQCVHKCVHIIDNNGTIEQLESAVKNLMRRINDDCT